MKDSKSTSYLHINLIKIMTLITNKTHKFLQSHELKKYLVRVRKLKEHTIFHLK